MLIGVLGAGELERPLLLRLSEHSQRITISQNSRIAYLLPVEYVSLDPRTLSGLGVSLDLTAGTAYMCRSSCYHSIRASMFNPHQYSRVVLPSQSS